MRKYKTSKELDGAIARLMRVVTAEGVGLVRDERVRAALREMKMSRKGGQIETARLVRAVALVSEVACELLIDNNNRKSDSAVRNTVEQG